MVMVIPHERFVRQRCYYYSDFDKLSKTPLPISIAIQLRKDYEKFN